MRTKFRIIYDQYGRTGNRFFGYLDSIGWAIKKNKKVIILFPEKFLEDFDNFRNSKYISLPLWGKKRLCSLVNLLFNNKLAIKFLKTPLAKKIGLYAGWTDLRESHLYYPKVKTDIQTIFIPNRYIKDPIDEMFEKFHGIGKTIVGVHIRRGDYKTAYNGMFYYDDEDYMDYCQQMSNLKKNVVFYIATDEKKPEQIVRTFQVLDNPLNSAAGDLYALSQCDYIIGPPSTFNCWASFIGDVPLFTIKRKKEKISLDNFSIMRQEYCK